MVEKKYFFAFYECNYTEQIDQLPMAGVCYSKCAISALENTEN